MNLYLISQTKNNGYDSYDSAVVAAENDVEARIINPSHWIDCAELALGEWTEPENVTVRLIGIAIEGTPSGKILGSFNAG